MAEDPIITFSETLSLVLILVAFAIYLRLAFKAKSLGNFRFQLSVFLLIWVISEIPHIGETLGFLPATSYEDTGLLLHAASMATFAFFVGWKSLSFLTIHPPLTSSTSPPLPKSVKRFEA